MGRGDRGVDPEEPTVASVPNWRSASSAALRRVVPEGPGLRAIVEEERYERVDTLGRGGMGTVFMCRDRRVGRDVALKVMHQQHVGKQSLRARFEREARLQGQLEHPNVVPIYDLGVDEDGSPYFTMKKVEGHTLQHIIDQLRVNEGTFVRRYRERKLLTAFLQICLAVAYAHSRGVVHRDLKPENMIVGKFGAVYVIDWGVAKIMNTTADGAPRDVRKSISNEESGEINTSIGTVIGTAGYMSPEQLRGEVDQVSPRSDVYALGAVLFELLSLESLHPLTDPQAAMESTLIGADARPSQRAKNRNVSKDLDIICQRATAKDPANRFASAMELHAALEGYMEGERDEEHRLELARRRVVAAEAALKRVQQDPENSAEDRLAAIRNLNAAAALDPNNQKAVSLLVEAFTDAPQRMPPGAAIALNRNAAKQHARGSARLSLAYLGAALLLAAMIGMGVRSWLAVGLSMGSCLIAGAVLLLVARTRRLSVNLLVLETAAVCLANGLLCVFFGPFLVVPAAAASMALLMILHARANATMRWILILLSMASLLVPALLQNVGVLPQTYAFENGSLIVRPWAVDLPPGLTLAVLLGAGLFMIAVPALLLGRALDQLAVAERRLFAQAWFFRQLAPDRVRAGAPLKVTAGHTDPPPPGRPPPTGAPRTGADRESLV